MWKTEFEGSMERGLGEQELPGVGEVWGSHGGQWGRKGKWKDDADHHGQAKAPGGTVRAVLAGN